LFRTVGASSIQKGIPQNLKGVAMKLIGAGSKLIGSDALC